MNDAIPPFSPLRIERDGARVRTVSESAHCKAALYYYPAGIRHSRHEHDAAGFTFLLSGGFEDDWEGRESAPNGPCFGYRPQGVRHACRFGRDGALILSILLRDDTGTSFNPHVWRPSRPSMPGLFALLFAQAAWPDQVIDDLLAAASGGEPQRRASAPPRWLRLAVEEIRDDPTVEIGAVALRAGVHRVHLSRAFQAHYGVSPTHFRLHCKTAAAARHLVADGQSPAMAAVAAGFADQAHWTRASRALAGITPARLRVLLGA